MRDAVKAAAAGLGCLGLLGCVPEGGPYGGGPAYASSGPVYAPQSYGYAAPYYGSGPVVVPGAAVGFGFGGDRYRRDDYGRQRFERERFDRDRVDRDRVDRAREHYQRERLARPEQRPPPFQGAQPQPPGLFNGARHAPPPPPGAGPRPPPQGGLIGRPVGRPPWDRS